MTTIQQHLSKLGQARCTYSVVSGFDNRLPGPGRDLAAKEILHARFFNHVAAI
jgi:hypothetical protein